MFAAAPLGRRGGDLPCARRSAKNSHFAVLSSRACGEWAMSGGLSLTERAVWLGARHSAAIDRRSRHWHRHRLSRGENGQFVAGRVLSRASTTGLSVSIGRLNAGSVESHPLLRLIFEPGAEPGQRHLSLAGRVGGCASRSACILVAKKPPLSTLGRRAAARSDRINQRPTEHVQRPHRWPSADIWRLGFRTWQSPAAHPLGRLPSRVKVEDCPAA